MKYFLCSLFALIYSCNSAQKTTVNYTVEESASKFAQTITEEELKTHLYIYASDEFAGRETGKEGQKKAVNYIRKYYQDLGIPVSEGQWELLSKSSA